MNSLYRNEDGTYCTAIGGNIICAIREAIALAQHNKRIEFKLNGRTIVVAKDADPQKIYQDWENEVLSGTK